MACVRERERERGRESEREKRERSTHLTTVISYFCEAAGGRSLLPLPSAKRRFYSQGKKEKTCGPKEKKNALEACMILLVLLWRLS
jgi:hypothetical protein